jgi:hypothetical protein
MSRQSQFVAELESLGYVFDRRNSKGSLFYIHEGTGAELRTGQNVSDSEQKNLVKKARQRIGIATCDNKRDPSKIKDREQALREREKATRDRELALRNLTLSQKSGDEIAAARDQQIFEDADRRFRYYDQMMRSARS